LAEVEKVHVLGGPSESFEAALRTLEGVANVLVHQIPTNDVWIRDYGPTFVIDPTQKKLGAVRWIFNAWGNKYHPYDSDAAASKRICQGLDQSGHWMLEPQSDSSNPLECFESKLVCEGGALETDGQGTLLTTSSAVATGTRNPHWMHDQIESELKRQLGIRKVLWIDGGELAGTTPIAISINWFALFDPRSCLLPSRRPPMTPTHRTWLNNTRPSVRLPMRKAIHSRSSHFALLPQG
jgi:agmatine deiminase